MALRARLVAPPPVPSEVRDWHQLNCASIQVSDFLGGDRRMEAETYLATGYGLRLAIEKKDLGWKRLSDVALTSQPNRLKGIQVAPEFGIPFLAATQVYDARPIPRKWLSLDRTSDSVSRFVTNGTILVTRSGSVGRATLAYLPHEKKIISDDLLRVKLKDARDWGWLYAYFHAPQTRAITKSAHYGHMIKHLEISHLDALPVPIIGDEAAEQFSQKASRILELRNESYQLTLEAENLFERALSVLRVEDWGESGFTIRAGDLLRSKRKRVNASTYNPGVALIREHLRMNGKGFVGFAEAGFDIWVPGRYKRIPAEDGVVYRDSGDLLEVSPDLTKRFADGGFGDEFRGRVKSGWILIPSSGQVYGIIGTATLATQALDDQVVSNHVIRAAPNKQNCVPVGYVLTALSHPCLGRPLIKALAFGSSVPEIDPDDVADLQLVRLESWQEAEIAEIAEASAKARALADLLEREVGEEAGGIIAEFIK